MAAQPASQGAQEAKAPRATSAEAAEAAAQGLRVHRLQQVVLEVAVGAGAATVDP